MRSSIGAPTTKGFWCAPGVGLGMRRLSIIDLASGHQPIANEDGTVWVVCNGEIYNFQELRAELEGKGHVFSCGSDIEVIVHLYEELGVRCLERLRGMFALALWDARRRSLLIARDRLGIKPLFFASDARRRALRLRGEGDRAPSTPSRRGSTGQPSITCCAISRRRRSRASSRACASSSRGTTWRRPPTGAVAVRRWWRVELRARLREERGAVGRGAARRARRVGAPAPA